MSIENREVNYYPWIDSLKGIAIIMVILQHLGFGNDTYYSWFYIGQSVPIFLFCSAFLCGKNNVFSFTFKKMK